MMLTQSDLFGLALAQYRLSKTLCDGCGDYHAVWPFLRSVGLVGGIDADRAPLMSALEDIASRHAAGPMRALVLGSADTAGVDLLLHALGPQLGSLTLMDRCRTPLAMCAEYVGGRVAFTSMQGDITQPLPVRGLDLIFSHSIIPFLDAPGRERLFRNIAQALQPDGALLMAVRLRAEEEPELQAPAAAEAWAREQAHSAARQFDQAAILTPLDRALLRDRLALAFYQRMSGLRLPYTSVDAMQFELGAAGLQITDVRLAGKGKAYAANGKAGGGRRGIIVTARRCVV
jgi:SAM-dependent methyltransferase